MKLIIHTDGGGQSGDDVGGKAASAYVVALEDNTYIGSRSETILGTNNDAEFNGVLMAVRDLAAGDLIPIEEIEKVTFISDSQLTVNSIRGDWRCKADNLRQKKAIILDHISQLKVPIEFVWKRREHNTDADRLCAAAMEHGPKTDFHAPIPLDPRKANGKKNVSRRV